jgi:hypothetical protein
MTTVKGSTPTWVSTAAEQKNVETTGGQSFYKLAEGNTPHDVAVMLSQSNPELGDVKTIRESILAANPDIDTNPAHRTDPAYKGKNDYQLEIGQKIKLPDGYATALVALAAADTTISVPVVETASPEPIAASPIDSSVTVVTADTVSAAPSEPVAATAALETVAGGGKAEPKEKKPGFGSKIFGGLQTLIDNGIKKQDARDAAAVAKYNDDKAQTAADKKTLDTYKGTITTPDGKYSSVVGYIDLNDDKNPSKVLERAKGMVADINAKEKKDVAQAKAKTEAADAKKVADAAKVAADAAKKAEVAARDERREVAAGLRANAKEVLTGDVPVKAGQKANTDMDTAQAAADSKKDAVADNGTR